MQTSEQVEAAMFLLHECVLAEEQAGSRIPTWVSVEKWHDRVCQALGLKVTKAHELGVELIRAGRIIVDKSGRQVMPNWRAV